MSLKTAEYNLEDFPQVYQPSEDTFLLIDALESELPYLRDLNPLTVLELGSGSGVVINSLASALKSPRFFSSDLNPTACLATAATTNFNNNAVETLNMNLLKNLKPHSFDVVIFNPPYVVTEPCEVRGRGLSRAWAGGKDGREVIDEVLGQVQEILRIGGVFYLLLLRENKPSEVVKVLQGLGLEGVVVAERRILGEYLFVYRFVKTR